MRQPEELIPRHRALAELAPQGAGDRLGILLLDGAHHRAEVHGLDDDSHAPRREGLLSPDWLRIDPTFVPLKGNPRFERLIAGE